jgi:hypothetical protein
MSKTNKKNRETSVIGWKAISRTAPRPAGPAGYGKHYFCVEVPHKKANKTKRIYFWADWITVEHGVLVAYSNWPRMGTQDIALLAFQHYEWLRCFAANVLTGEALVVDNRK